MSPEESHMPEDGHMDMDIIEELRREVGDETLSALMHSLQNELQAAFVSATKQFSNKDFTALEVNAHSMKSVSKSFGMSLLGEASLRLEEACRAQIVVPALMEEFLTESRAALNSVTAFIERM